MYRFVAKHVLAPLLDVCRGTHTLKCLRELEKSQWWPRDGILAFQDERLRSLIRHAYDNVPYYRRVFEKRELKPDDIQTSEDLVKLPILTKQLIRNNFTDLVARSFPKKEIVPGATGGSTGEPLRFYRTKDERDWGHAAALRAHGWTGYKIGDKRVWVREKETYKSAVENFVRTSQLFLRRIVVLNALEMSTERLPLYAKKLQDIQPEFIHGQPTAIQLLAKFLEKEAKPTIKPKAVVTGGEQLYDYQRNLFSRVFECEVYSYYGSMEMHGIASECPEHTGYHISAENIVVEIVNSEGKLTPVGEEGRILATNLRNYAMPFIRYDNGDVAAISDSICPCGRGLPLLATISGRTTDVIFTKDGKCIPGISLPFDVFASPGVEQFQIVQETRDSVVIRVVLDRTCPRNQVDDTVEQILYKYRSILGEDTYVSVESVEQILPTRSGKTRVVISNELENQMNT